MALEGGAGSASHPGRSLPPEKNRYPLYRRLGGRQDRSGHVRKISPSPGFDARTAQPVASRYTDYATQPTIYEMWKNAVKPDRSQMTIRRLRIACSIPKATRRHLEYAILCFTATMVARTRLNVTLLCTMRVLFSAKCT
jgi:hypothetical protein